MANVPSERFYSIGLQFDFASWDGSTVCYPKSFT